MLPWRFLASEWVVSVLYSLILNTRTLFLSYLWSRRTKFWWRDVWVISSLCNSSSPRRVTVNRPQSTYLAGYFVAATLIKVGSYLTWFTSLIEKGQSFACANQLFVGLRMYSLTYKMIRFVDRRLFEVLLHILFHAKRNYFLLRISPQTLFPSSTEALGLFILWRWTKCRMWVISVNHVRSWRFNMRPYVKWSDRLRISSFLFFSNVLFGENEVDAKGLSRYFFAFFLNHP